MRSVPKGAPRRWLGSPRLSLLSARSPAALAHRRASRRPLNDLVREIRAFKPPSGGAVVDPHSGGIHGETVPRRQRRQAARQWSRRAGGAAGVRDNNDPTAQHMFEFRQEPGLEKAEVVNLLLQPHKLMVAD